MSRQRRIQIIAAVVVFAVVLGALLLRHYHRYPTTDDGYVDADVVGIVARVAGPIVDLPIADNQPVRAGELLFTIDSAPVPDRGGPGAGRARSHRPGRDRPRGCGQQCGGPASATTRRSCGSPRPSGSRVEPLAKIGAVPFQDRDKAQANLDGARAGLDNANAELAQAQANLGELDENNPDIRAAVAQLETTPSSS